MTPTRTVALVLALAGLGVAAPAPRTPQASQDQAAKPVTVIRVTVTVLDPQGNPVQGAGVVLRQDSVDQGRLPRRPFDVEDHTDNHGVVTVQGFQPGVVLVQVIARGFQTYGQAFIMRNANESVHVQLQLPQHQLSSE